MLAVSITLTACQTETGSGSSEGDGDGETSPPPSDDAILNSFFVESFAPFETAAWQLVEQDPRYLLQKHSWYFDDNGNDRLDPATEQSYDTYPLVSSGVHFAHAAGLTGAGQIIAITDDGFLNTHEAFADKSIHEAGSLPVEDHGTAVASVAAGNSDKMIGMAPGADLAFGSFATFETRTEATRMAEQLGAVAQNNSWGFVDSPVSQTTFDKVFATAKSQDYLAALHSYAEAGVVIFAASNDRDNTQAGLMEALPLLEPGLKPGWMAVINGEAVMDGDDVVAARRISAACLEAAAWCLAAEGSWTGASASAPDSYSFKTGTSFAAPMVAGAMAILGEAFPDLSPHDLRIRLLASADNSFTGFTATGQVELVGGFFHDISEEWGHGFLDVKAALLPIGQTTATMADGSSYNIEDPLAVEGAATGDAVTRALKNVSLAVDDALAAQFSLPAERLVAERGQIAVADALRLNWETGTEAGCCNMASYYPATRNVGFQSEDITVNLMLPSGQTADDSFGMILGRDFDSDIGHISTRLSLGRDNGDLLPAWHSGGESTIMAVEMELTAPVTSGIDFELAAGMGATLSDSQDRGGGTSFNSATATMVSRDVFASADRLSVSFGLPVAVSSGSTEVTLPVTTRDGSTQFQAIGVDLAPAQRELRFAIDYAHPLGDTSEVLFSAGHSENFGNIGGRRSTGLLLGYRMHF